MITKLQDRYSRVLADEPEFIAAVFCLFKNVERMQVKYLNRSGGTRVVFRRGCLGW